MIESLENRNVQFLSLATDDDADLVNFLQEHKFLYETIGNSKQLIEQVLGLTAYPRHLIVDNNGKIFKVLNNVNELKLALNSYLKSRL